MYFEYNKKVKKCRLCKTKKKLEEFSFRNKVRNIRTSYCKTCTRKYVREHYVRNRKYYLSKAKKRNDSVRYLIKQYTWNYLSTHSCIDCGESDPVVLEFDHVSDKISEISGMYRNFSLNTVIQEIRKCEIRCANCHRRKTARIGGWHKKFKPL